MQGTDNEEDRAEDPEKMIRLIIQEMEDTLVEVRTAAASTIAERKEIERTAGRYREAQAEWQRKAEVALRKDREDLSKAALIEKAKLAQATEAMEKELGALDPVLAQGEADISQLAAKLKEAKAKQQTIQARHDTASSRLKVRRRLHDGRVEDAFSRFEMVEKRLDAAEGAVEAFDLGASRTLTEEIADLEAESTIEDELTALKARLGKERGAGKRT
jgi:phage shock protein A